jgi:hypothetical protein
MIQVGACVELLWLDWGFICYIHFPVAPAGQCVKFNDLSELFKLREELAIFFKISLQNDILFYELNNALNISSKTKCFQSPTTHSLFQVQWNILPGIAFIS